MGRKINLAKVLPVQRSFSIFESDPELFASLKVYQGPTATSLCDLNESHDPQDLDGFEKSFSNSGSFHDKSSVNGPDMDKLSGLLCSTCQVQFDSLGEQRSHFHLDWHRYNVKQKVANKSILSEDEFELQVQGELSSISGSDSEEEEDRLLSSGGMDKISICEDQESPKGNEFNNLFRTHPLKIFLETKDSLLLSVYRNAAAIDRKDSCDDGACLKVSTLPCERLWVYVLFSAGHVAAAVFERNNILEHKTFHRYVIRAKRGTVQSAHDAKNSFAKSGGATLRRYNEAALVKEVQDLLKSWSSYIKQANKIFLKCSQLNSHVFFSGKSPVLEKDDVRIQKISLLTNRPTFKEVKRIHALFSNVEVYGPLKDVEAKLGVELANVELTDREEPVKAVKPPPALAISNPAAVSRSPNISRQAPSKSPKAPASEKPTPLADEGIVLWNNLYDCCRKSDLKALVSLLKPEHGLCALHQVVESSSNFKDNCLVQAIEASYRPSPACPDHAVEATHGVGSATGCICESKEVLSRRRSFIERRLINRCANDPGETLLHCASKGTCTEIVSFLLDFGADPSIKDKRGKLPFNIACSKDMRNEFRRYMARHPELYDYKAAQIPSPLTEEAESDKQKRENDRRKQIRKASKQKQKAKKADEQRQKAEERDLKSLEEETTRKAEAEKKQFDSLSDREKRAAMAERRFASQLTASKLCANCKKSLANLVPFSRYEYEYCSTDCVHEHKRIIAK